MIVDDNEALAVVEGVEGLQHPGLSKDAPSEGPDVNGLRVQCR
jgi:hypothetical protein